MILGCLTASCGGFLGKLTDKLTVSWNHLIPCSIKKMLAQPGAEVISSTEDSKCLLTTFLVGGIALANDRSIFDL